MSRNRREHGRIISVETHTRGDALAEDAAAGATSITVEDAGDFDEDGGWLTIGGQVVEFSECDDDTGVILLADPLTAAAEQGDPVQVWSDLYDEVIEYQQALVELDGEYDNPDPVVAEVAEGVGELPEGDRGKAGESCTLKRVADDEWEVVGVGGRSAKSRRVRWEQDDFYTLAAGDVTAGTVAMPLSHRPCDEALTCVLAGVPQRPTNWTINYDAQTLTFPLSGWEQVGMVLWVHYAYRKGVNTAVIPPAPVAPLYVAQRTAFNSASSLAYPTGTQVGDLIILGIISGWDDDDTCTDSRMTLIASDPRADRQFKVWAGYASDLATPLAVTLTNATSAISQYSQATAATWRGVGGEHLQWKPGAVAVVGSGWSGQSATLAMPGLPDTDLSGAICVYLAIDGTGGVYSDQDWTKAPVYAKHVDVDNSYTEVDMALTTTVPVPAQTTPNTDSSSGSGAWVAVVIGVQ